ncbi:Protein CBG22134, partial [Caenorhabditis briggsae]
IALRSRISSNKAVTLRETQLDAVMRLRAENQARLTDCISLQFRQLSHECCTLSDMWRTCSDVFFNA